MNAQLQQFVNRIERLESEKKTITADISEVYKEAKANGFDPKIMRKLIAKRKKPAAERQEEESLLDVYEVALGGVDNGPVTFTRKDGVKVTLERVIERVNSILFDDAEEFDAVTGEIADHVHVGPTS